MTLVKEKDAITLMDITKPEAAVLQGKDYAEVTVGKNGSGITTHEATEVNVSELEKAKSLLLELFNIEDPADILVGSNIMIYDNEVKDKFEVVPRDLILHQGAVIMDYKSNMGEVVANMQITVNYDIISRMHFVGELKSILSNLGLKNTKTNTFLFVMLELFGSIDFLAVKNERRIKRALDPLAVLVDQEASLAEYLDVQAIYVQNHAMRRIHKVRKKLKNRQKGILKFLD